MITPKAPNNRLGHFSEVKRALFAKRSWANKHVNSVEPLSLVTPKSTRMKSLFPKHLLWLFSSKKRFKPIISKDSKNYSRMVLLSIQVLITSRNLMEKSIKSAIQRLFWKLEISYIDINKTEIQYSWTDNQRFSLCLSAITKFKLPKHHKPIRLI